MYNKLYDNLLSVVSYNRETGDTSLVGLNIAIKLEPGVYEVVRGGFKPVSYMQTTNAIMADEMFAKFMEQMTWNKPVINKVELYQLSSVMSTSILPRIIQSRVQVNNKLEILGGVNYANDIATICCALTYKLIAEIVAKDRVEYNKSDLSIINNTLDKASRVYSINSDFGLKVFQVVAEYINLFATSLIYPYVKPVVASINTKPINIQIGMLQNLIFKAKQIIISASAGSKTFQDYTKITSYLVKVLVEEGIYEELINSLYKYQFPAKDAAGLFGESEEDKWLKSVSYKAITYYKERIAKLKEKGLGNVSAQNIVIYEKGLKGDIEKIIDDAIFMKSFYIRTYYEYNKKVTILSLREDASLQDAGVRKLQGLWINLTKMYSLYISKDVPTIEQEQGTTYTEGYSSVITKYKMETMVIGGKPMLEVRYTEPYISDIQKELEWTK